MNPKQKYIPIRSLHDLDPNKLSITQIQQKFIDSEKNKYSLRFDKETRRIEILKMLPNQEWEVVKKGSSAPPSPGVEDKLKSALLEASLPPKIHSETETNIPVNLSFVNTRTHQRDHKKELIDDEIDLNIFDTPPPVETGKRAASASDSSKLGSKANTGSTNQTGARLNPSDEAMAEHFIDLLTSQRERISYILKNLKNSHIFEATGDPSENKNIVGNFEREVDMEVFQEIEKLVQLNKEMLSFPRPITYYISKVPSETKESLKDFSTDKERFFYLFSFEMKRGIDLCLKRVKSFSMQMLALINMKTETQVKQLQYSNQLLYSDAKAAAIFFAQELDGILKDFEKWKNLNG